MRRGGNAIHWVMRLVCICLLVQMYISLPAWLSGWRSVPLAPVIPGFILAPWLEILLFIIIQICLLALLIKPFRLFIVPLIIALATMIMADVTRLQPWLFLYILILISILVFKNDSKKQVIFSWQIIFSCTYFWSGIQKLNPHFLKELAPWLVEFSGTANFFEAHPAAGFIFPIFESAGAFALWFMPTRRIAVFVLLLMHLFILLSLGPLGHNWNEVVWPWNILFAILLFILFWNKSIGIDWKTVKSPFILSLIFIVGFMPLLNIFGRWQHFLSAGFYSGMAPEAIFYYSPHDRKKMPSDALPFAYGIPGQQEEFIALDYWALANLRLPLYPENEGYKPVAKKICTCISDANTAGIRINHKNRFSNHQWIEEIKCSELLKR